jgi:hypothetical protein
MCRISLFHDYTSWFGLGPSGRLQHPFGLLYLYRHFYEGQYMVGRPPGRIHDQILQMRVSDEFLATVDAWRRKQDDEPSRSEAIRRLVELGLQAPAPKRKTR